MKIEYQITSENVGCNKRWRNFFQSGTSFQIDKNGVQHNFHNDAKHTQNPKTHNKIYSKQNWREASGQ